MPPTRFRWRAPEQGGRTAAAGSAPADTVTVRVVDLHGGAGRAMVAGRLASISGVIPGERIEVTMPRPGKATARLVRVIEPSPSRVDPRCRHTTECGGCSWQHMSYREQRRVKRADLQAQIDAALGRGVFEVGAVMAPDGRTDDEAPTPWGFRDKVHFVCAPGRRGGIALGHFAAGGQRVVAVTECPVHGEAGNTLARRVADACERAGVQAATTDGRRGLLRHIVVRVPRIRGEAQVTLVVTNDRDPALRRLAREFGRDTDEPVALHVNVLAGPSSWLFGPDTRTVCGRPFLREDVAGVSYLVAPTAFFQTNVAAAETLVRLVLEAVPPEASEVLDLYAGCGLFALPLARRGHRVLAVEEHPGSVAAGRRSQRLNRIDERACRFVQGRVEDVLATRGGATVPRAPQGARDRGVPPAREGPVVILDPPRTGCSGQVLRRLMAEVGPRRLVYVSCEPEALARDLATWFSLAEQHGASYRVVRVQPLDMFPHTPHLEIVAVLERLAVDGANGKTSGGRERPARPTRRRPTPEKRRRRP